MPTCGRWDRRPAADVRHSPDTLSRDRRSSDCRSSYVSERDERVAPQCSDGADNDGDGLVDRADPGCHTDGDPSNDASYDPNDDSEADGSGTSSAGLPMTGSNIIGLGLAGLLLLAGGLLLRRHEGAHAAA